VEADEGADSAALNHPTDVSGAAAHAASDLCATGGRALQPWQDGTVTTSTPGTASPVLPYLSNTGKPKANKKDGMQAKQHMIRAKDVGGDEDGGGWAIMFQQL